MVGIGGTVIICRVATRAGVGRIGVVALMA